MLATVHGVAKSGTQLSDFIFYICITELLCGTPETNTIYQLYFNLKKKEENKIKDWLPKGGRQPNGSLKFLADLRSIFEPTT